MPRNGVAYEKPSRLSRGMVVCLSIAVIGMAAWLATMIMFSEHSSTLAADEADIQPAAGRSSAPSVSPEPTRTGATVRSDSGDLETSPWSSKLDFVSTTPSATPRSALPPASLAEFSGDSAPGSTYTSSVATGVPAARDRGVWADELAPQTDTDGVALDITQLPLPKPRPTASIPVPRPRPQLDAEDVLPGARQSFFDFLMNPQR
jgi:hypothetical protein